MTPEQARQRCIEAYKSGALNRPIVIQTDADFTPPGKRTARLVRHSKTGRRTDQQLRWYVGTSAYRTLPLTRDNVRMTEAWKAGSVWPPRQPGGQLELLLF